MTTEPRPAFGRFAVTIRLDGDYRLPYPDAYPGGASSYLSDLSDRAVGVFESHLLYGSIEKRRVNVVQEVEYDQVSGAIA